MLEGHTGCPMCHWRLASTGDGDEQGFVRGTTRCAMSSSRLATLLSRKHAAVDWLEVDDRSSDVLAKTRERWGHSGSSWSTTDGLDSVSLCSAVPTADFPEWTREWQEDDYDQLGNLLDPKLRKEKERRIRVGVEAETLRLRSPE